MPFQPGVSGNPSGRPKENNEVKALARANAPQAMQTLIDIMTNGEQKLALQAANAVLDRAYGKPVQAIVGDDDAPPIRQVLTWKHSTS